jgi:hypothetical protein
MVAAAKVDAGPAPSAGKAGTRQRCDRIVGRGPERWRCVTARRSSASSGKDRSASGARCIDLGHRSWDHRHVLPPTDHRMSQMIM